MKQKKETLLTGAGKCEPVLPQEDRDFLRGPGHRAQSVHVGQDPLDRLGPSPLGC